MRRNFIIGGALACLGIAAWFVFGPGSNGSPVSRLNHPVDSPTTPAPAMASESAVLDPTAESPPAPDVSRLPSDPQPRLALRVMNYSGDPVAGAVVRVTQERREAQRLTTDEDGRFEAELEPDRTVRFDVSCRGCEELVVVCEVSAVPSELVVSERATIRVVIDEAIRPWISEFDVKLRGPQGESRDLWAEPTSTGVDFIVRAGRLEFVVVGGPCVPVPGEVDLRGGEIAVLHYPGTEAAGPLVVSVVDRDDGTPIERATVHVQLDHDGDAMKLVTSPDGTTTVFGLRERNASVVVSAPGYVTATFDSSDTPGSGQAWTVGLAPLAAFEFVVRRGGLPVPGVVVGIEPDDGCWSDRESRDEMRILDWIGSGVTDDSGYVRVEEISPGPYRVYVRSIPNQVLAVSRTEMGADDQRVDLDLPPLGRVHGTVLRNGEPISGELRFTSGELEVALVVADGDFDGAVGLSRCEIWFRGDGFETFLDEVTLPIDRALEFRYESFELVVDLPQPQLRPKYLRLRRVGDPRRVATFPTGRGSARLPDVPAGTYDVQLVDDRWSRGSPIWGDYYPSQRVTIDRDTHVTVELATNVGLRVEFAGSMPLLVARLLPSGRSNELDFSADGSTLEMGWPERESGWGLIQPSGGRAPIFFRVETDRSVSPPRLEPQPAGRLTVDRGVDATTVEYRIRPDGWPYGPSSYWDQRHAGANLTPRLLAPGRYRVEWFVDDVEAGVTVVDVEAGAEARAVFTDGRR